MHNDTQLTVPCLLLWWVSSCWVLFKLTILCLLLCWVSSCWVLFKLTIPCLLLCWVSLKHNDTQHNNKHGIVSLNHTRHDDTQHNNKHSTISINTTHPARRHSVQHHLAVRVILPSVTVFVMLSCHNAECHYTDCCYAESRYSDCRYSECCSITIEALLPKKTEALLAQNKLDPLN